MPAERWQLHGFLACVDEWVDAEDPPTWLRFVVQEWILSRFDDPYQGVRREEGFENLWFGQVPTSGHDGLAVICSYWIEERGRRVRCDRIASLSWPV